MSDLYVALIVGVALSLIYAEKTGIVPAGLIVPGYLAMIFDQPLLILTMFFISIVTYLIVVHVVGRFTILYGRRKFAAMLTVGIIVKLIVDQIYPVFPFEIHELRGIGIIVPGVIANTIQKQGVVPTLSSTFILSGLTFLILNLYYLL